MDTARLSLRPEETIHLFESRPQRIGPYQVYAVALVKTLPFPGTSHAECDLLTLICAQMYQTSEGENTESELWGWVHMDFETKSDIGSYMLENDAEIGKWYFLVVELETARKH